MIGGSLGGLIGMATGRRSTLFVVAAERDGFTFAATFAAVDEDAKGLLHAIQRGRRDRGVQPLPKIEELEGMAAKDLATEQLDLLRGISKQLSEQTALLREIARKSAWPAGVAQEGIGGTRLFPPRLASGPGRAGWRLGHEEHAANRGDMGGRGAGLRRECPSTPPGRVVARLT